MKERIGQPAEHLPHWKQRRTDVPDNFSTLWTKSRFMVRADSDILVVITSYSIHDTKLYDAADGRDQAPVSSQRVGLRRRGRIGDRSG